MRKATTTPEHDGEVNLLLDRTRDSFLWVRDLVGAPGLAVSPLVNDRILVRGTLSDWEAFEARVIAKAAYVSRNVYRAEILPALNAISNAILNSSRCNG